MSTTIQVKRSAVQGKVPTTTDLSLGELAINTYDGKLYLKKNVNGTESIVDVSSSQSAIDILNLIKTVDGPGSGLDADLLDGIESSEFARLNDDVIFNSVQLSGGTGTQGTLSWNADEETLDVIQNDAVLQLGQELQVHCRNNTGSLIPNGTPVMATGTLGASGRITIAPMDATDPANAMYILGIVTEDIAAGSDGKVTTFGKVRGVDTTDTSIFTGTIVDGDVLYPDPVNVGKLTNTPPSAPNLHMHVAFVIHAASNGTLMVRVSATNEAQWHPYMGIVSANSTTLSVNGDMSLTRNGSSSVTRTLSLGGAQQSDGTDFSRLDFINYDSNDASPEDYIAARIAAQNESGVEYGNLIFSTGYIGSLYERMRIKASGAVGIGTTSPLARLHVSGTASGYGFRVNDNVYVGNGTVTTGRQAATYPLTAQIDGDSLILVSSGNNAGTSGVRFYGSGDRGSIYADNAYDMFIEPNAQYGNVDIILKAKNDTTYSAKVGINTSIPNSPLHVAGDIYSDDGVEAQAFYAWGSPHSYTNGAGGTQGIMLDYIAGVGNIRAFNNASGTGTAEIAFITGGSERVRIDDSGNVGIGTSSPALPLEVQDNDQDQITVGVYNQFPYGAGGYTAASALVLGKVESGTRQTMGKIQAAPDTNISSTAGYLSFHTRVSSSTTEKMRITSAGNVGIGTTSPGTPLDVNGTARATQFRLASTGVLDDATATTTATTQVAIDSWSASTYGGGKIVIEAKDGVNRHIVELLVTHDGTTAIATEYGAVYTSGVLATYDVDISGGNVRILATPASTNSTVFKVMKTTMFA